MKKTAVICALIGGVLAFVVIFAIFLALPFNNFDTKAKAPYWVNVTAFMCMIFFLASGILLLIHYWGIIISEIKQLLK